MASYIELQNLAANAQLQQKVAVACVVEAADIAEEDPGTTNHANRLLWAASALRDPGNIGRAMLWAVLAINKELTAQQIIDASDVAIQANVKATVDLFASGA